MLIIVRVKKANVSPKRTLMTSEIDPLFLTGLSECHVDFAGELNQDSAPIYDYA